LTQTLNTLKNFSAGSSHLTRCSSSQGCIIPY